VGTTVGIRGASGDGDDAIGIVDFGAGGVVVDVTGVEVVRGPALPVGVFVASGMRGVERTVFTRKQ
jgi:hypothetical protein